MGISKKLVVVLGTGGMGSAIVRRLGAGATVMLADFDPARLNNAAQNARDNGHDIVTHEVDVSDADSVHRLANACSALGPVTTVVHTAGVSPVQASISRILEIDLLGAAIVLDEFQKIIAPGGAGVFIASLAGVMADLSREFEALLTHTPTAELLQLPELQASQFKHGHHAYHVAKRCNQLRVRAAAAAWGLNGARVNSLSPGIIATPMTKAELENGDIVEAMNRMIAQCGTKRIGTPDDIAAAVAFLTGPEAAYITGTDLLVDGGVFASYHDGLLI